MLLLLLVACDSPADGAVEKWVEFLDHHRALIAQDEFDAEAFLAQGKPLVNELRRHRNPKDGQILVTSFALEDWDRANEAFRVAVNDHLMLNEDDGPANAFRKLIDKLKENGKP